MPRTPEPDQGEGPVASACRPRVAHTRNENSQAERCCSRRGSRRARGAPPPTQPPNHPTTHTHTQAREVAQAVRAHAAAAGGLCFGIHRRAHQAAAERSKPEQPFLWHPGPHGASATRMPLCLSLSPARSLLPRDARGGAARHPVSAAKQPSPPSLAPMPSLSVSAKKQLQASPRSRSIAAQRGRLGPREGAEKGGWKRRGMEGRLARGKGGER